MTQLLGVTSEQKVLERMLSSLQNCQRYWWHGKNNKALLVNKKNGHPWWSTVNIQQLWGTSSQKGCPNRRRHTQLARSYRRRCTISLLQLFTSKTKKVGTGIWPSSYNTGRLPISHIWALAPDSSPANEHPVSSSWWLKQLGACHPCETWIGSLVVAGIWGVKWYFFSISLPLK